MSPADPAPAGERSESTRGRDASQNIATTIAEVSERASLLVREEIELAKAEMTEKATKLARGAVVGVAAGIFLMTALFFVLVGCAWLLYYYLPIGNDFTYFYGFFAMAVILVLLGVIAGLIAARVVKKGAPPVPTMAIEEARRIRETVGPAAAGEHGPTFPPFEQAGGPGAPYAAAAHTGPEGAGSAGAGDASGSEG